MEYSNKIYTLEYLGQNSMQGMSHFVIVVAASSIELAKHYTKGIIGIDVDPICLISAMYPTIYVQDGSVPEKIQAKILYNGSYHV